MRRSLFGIVLFSILMCSSIIGQMEVKIYTGAFDRHGLAVEYAVNERIGIEIGGSFRTKKTSNFYVNADVGNRENNFYIHTKLKRYSAKKHAHHGFFYGAYLRYFQHYRTVTDMENWTVEQKEFAATDNAWISSRTHKTSIGILSGYKGKIKSSFNWEISFGLGGSFPFLYTERTIRTQDEQNGEVGRDLWVGYLNHLSVLGHLSVGYRF